MGPVRHIYSPSTIRYFPPRFLVMVVERPVVCWYILKGFFCIVLGTLSVRTFKSNELNSWHISQIMLNLLTCPEKVVRLLQFWHMTCFFTYAVFGRCQVGILRICISLYKLYMGDCSFQSTDTFNTVFHVARYSQRCLNLLEDIMSQSENRVLKQTVTVCLLANKHMVPSCVHIQFSLILYTYILYLATILHVSGHQCVRQHPCFTTNPCGYERYILK